MSWWSRALCVRWRGGRRRTSSKTASCSSCQTPRPSRPCPMGMPWHEPRRRFSSRTGGSGLPPSARQVFCLPVARLHSGMMLSPGQPDRHSLLLLTCTGMSTATELSTRHPAQQASRTSVSWLRPGTDPAPREPGRHLLVLLTHSSLGKKLLHCEGDTVQGSDIDWAHSPVHICTQGGVNILG